jgi:2-polyprenyl-3-methyl-5-hydroxy-6-metoxy-1,4-benzoquinol methylase
LNKTLMVPTEPCTVISARFRFVSLFFNAERAQPQCGVGTCMKPPDLTLESPPCPLCGGAAFSPVLAHARDRLTRKAGAFAVQSCQGCGLVVTRPRPTPEALAYYYEGTYSGGGSGRARALQTGALARLASRYRLRAVQRVQPVAAGQHLLDVGCGYGGFLWEAVQATGCVATGVEQDAGCVADALGAGRIRYLVGALDTAWLQPASQDVVTFFESLEHHGDPVAALKTAYTLLKPGGTCVVEVPNFNGAWRRVFGSWWLPLLVPQHLVHFTPDTLHATFAAAGFRQIRPARSMFYPTESTASLGLWLNDKLGRPIRGYRLRWKRPDGALLLLALAVWWLAVELPSQLALLLLGRTGHQLVTATK